MHMYKYWEGMVKVKAQVEAETDERGWTPAIIIRHVKHQTLELICNYFNSTRWFVGLQTQIKTCNALLVGD